MTETPTDETPRRPPRLPLLALALLALSLGGTAMGGTAQDGPVPATAPQPGVSGDGAGEDLDTFVPSERLPADVAVAFPVDI